MNCIDSNPFTPVKHVMMCERDSSVDVTLNSVCDAEDGVSVYPPIISVVFNLVPSMNFRTELSEGVTCFDP